MAALAALGSQDPLSDPMTEFLVYDSVTVPAVAHTIAVRKRLHGQSIIV